MKLLKVALLDTSFSSFPLIESLNLSKIELYVVGAKKNDFLCNLTGIKHIKSDYKNVKELDLILRNLSIDRIIPGCNDASFMSFLKLTDKYPISEEKFDQLNNKHQFRKLCRELNIPAPKIFEKNYELGDQKIIVKPELGFSGQGVTSLAKGANIHQIDDALRVAEQFSTNNRAIIEEFIEGQLFSISMFVHNYHPTQVFIVKEFCTENPYTVNWSYIDHEFTNQIKGYLSDLITILPKKLGIEKGLLHLQCIKCNTQSVFVIEATLRCPGDLYPLLIEFQLGENYSASYLEYFVEPNYLNYKKTSRTKSKIIRHTSSYYQKGTFTGFDHQNLQTIFSIPTLNFGEINNQQNKYRSGVHFYSLNSKFDNVENFTKNSKKVHQQI